jgi:hypothetical protein
MTNEKLPLELDDIYKTPIGDLLALSDQELDDLIVSAEDAYQKARKLKAWLSGVKRQKVSRKK